MVFTHAERLKFGMRPSQSALVKPALVKPALVKPALVKPALVKPAKQ